MKQIITIIIALLAISACEPEAKTDTFTPEVLAGTKWEGSLKEVDGKLVKNTSEVTIRFITVDKGQMTNRQTGTGRKESYELNWSSAGQNISIDCPVINGTWAVSGYTEKSMTLTLLPGKDKVMALVRQ